MLEAKLVSTSGLALSVLSEFVENGDGSLKQDCELKAVHRLMQRLKEAFPALPLCLSLDGLFANGPVIGRCEQYGWRYVIVHKDACLPSVHEEFAALWPLESSQQLSTTPAEGVHRHFRWVQELSYTDSQQQTHLLNALHCQEITRSATGQEESKTFKCLTNFPLRSVTIQPIFEQGGRQRWNIENQGFNTQKRGGFQLEHAYSEDPNAAKVFYLLLQMAHNLLQLMQQSTLFRREDGTPCSLRQLACRLKEAWRNRYLAQAELQATFLQRWRISLDTS